MKRSKEHVIQLSSLSKMQNADERLIRKSINPIDRIEFHNKKIVPKVNSIPTDEGYENEWQQEYFVIYNSYILEELNY